jgi:thioredoxin 2
MTASSVVACPGCGRRNRVPAAAAGAPRCAQCHRWLPWLVDAGDDDFAAVAGASPMLVLVDLWAPWCAPCRQVAPSVERLSVERAGHLKVVKVNVDEAPGLARQLDAMSIPTLLLVRGGDVVDRVVGAASYERLASWVDRAMSA